MSQEAGYLNADMKTAIWEGKRKVLEAQDGISNSGLEVRRGQRMETKQEKKRRQKNIKEKTRTSIVKYKDV